MNNTQNMIGMLRQGKTGNEMLKILDEMLEKDQCGFTYIESHKLIPTLETIEF